MQLRLDFSGSVQAPAETPAALQASPPLVIHYVRVRTARRYVMRVRPDGALRVTIPRGGSQAEARRFADRHRGWALRQRATVLAAKRPPDVERALKDRAQRELPPRLFALAAANGLTVRRITIRDQRSRWGSCSPKAHIALNYRLLLMPESVRDYILVHELMHLRQPDHSRAFWRLVEAACPAFREAERWLRRHGSALF
ncbi:MAG TPA: SprT family zinc-dependent metalloprotease [Vicinamibacterales bacterium]